MPLLPEDKARIRYHTGYPNVSEVATLAFGLPVSVETGYLIENMMNVVREEAIPRIRNILDVMDGIEKRMECAATHFSATSLGDITTNLKEDDDLERLYCRWAGRLADILRSPLYKGSLRFQKYVFGAAGVNVPVRH